MKASIITHALSTAEEERFFSLIHQYHGRVTSANYDSKSTFYKLEFPDQIARTNFSKAYESYKFREVKLIKV